MERKHLELFNNGFDATLEEKLKPENWPYIGYDLINDTVAWSTIVGKEEPLVPGFVKAYTEEDGSIVLWATSNVGANSPEETGRLTSKSGGMQGHNYPSELESICGTITYKCPSMSDWTNLKGHSTYSFETLNGVPGIRFTFKTVEASSQIWNDGKSIFIPEIDSPSLGAEYKGCYWSSNMAANYADGQTDYAAFYWLEHLLQLDANNFRADIGFDSTFLIPTRAMCIIPPLPHESSKYIKLGDSMISGNNIYAISSDAPSLYFKSLTTNKITASFYTTYGGVDEEGTSTLIKEAAFSKTLDGSVLQLSTVELDNLFGGSSRKRSYVYVCFQCVLPATINMLEWNASSCADKSTLIVSGNEIRVASKSGNTVYRLLYDEWKGNDLIVDWWSNSTLPLYIADKCTHVLSSSAGAVVYYYNIPRKTIKTIPAATVDSWASRVDADGFLYIRMNPSAAGTVIFASSKPVE